jgi:hypothetical protein
MAVRYYQLTAEELKEEREKQQEIVRTSTPDNYLDEYHKLSVMESLIAWHAAEAYRSGGVKQKLFRVRERTQPGGLRQESLTRGRKSTSGRASR